MKNSRQSGIKWRMLLAGICLSVMVGQAGIVTAKEAASTGNSAPPKMQKAGIISTADHSKFKVLNQEFATGPEVTKACLSCHTEAGKQFHKTYHWTWQSTEGIQKGIGKKNVLNNF
jgi:hypothetical protein